MLCYSCGVMKDFDAQISLPTCEFRTVEKQQHSVQFSLVILFAYLKENCAPIKLIELVGWESFELTGSNTTCAL